ncbi:MAG: hypothetical protein ACFFFY_10660 [Promethearchaeota archaeon]
MSSEIKIFKLNYSGSFEKILPEKILNNLTLFNVLTFYIPNQKKMYVWIGKKVSQSLKSLIPQIRAAISREHPELQVLRNITIESGLESPEFLENIGIEESILKSNIKELEIKLLPVISEINRLKSKADDYFISNNYHGAIINAQKVVMLAKAINDDSLEKDQISFITEARSRVRANQILQEIETLCKEATEEFDQLVKDEKYQDAHKLVENIKERYADNYNLSTIPLAQQLLLKNENMVYRLKIEQESILKEINAFINLFDKNFNNPTLKDMKAFLQNRMNMSQHFLDNKIKYKLKEVSDIYYRMKENLVNKISQSSGLAIKYMENGEISKAIETFEEIVQNLAFDNRYSKSE